MFLSGEFRSMIDVNFVCAMGPPGGGRNPVTPRLMRHFNYLAFTELEDPSKRTIFGTILGGWTRAFNCSFVYQFHEICRKAKYSQWHFDIC